MQGGYRVADVGNVRVWLSEYGRELETASRGYMKVMEGLWTPEIDEDGEKVSAIWRETATGLHLMDRNVHVDWIGRMQTAMFPNDGV